LAAARSRSDPPARAHALQPQGQGLLQFAQALLQRAARVLVDAGGQRLAQRGAAGAFPAQVWAGGEPVERCADRAAIGPALERRLLARGG